VKRVDLREARRNLSALIEEARKGREIVITDRGKAVARLVPPQGSEHRPFPALAAFRRTMPVLDPPLSETIVEDLEDRF
jgi:prevent-host-death family protein